MLRRRLNSLVYAEDAKRLIGSRIWYTILVTLGVSLVYLLSGSSSEPSDDASYNVTLAANPQRAGLSQYLHLDALSPSNSFGDLFSSISSRPAASAFELPPARSTLPARFKRFTLIAIWDSNARPNYMPGFFDSVALNSGVADLLAIHITEDPEQCLTQQTAEDNVRRGAEWDWENGGSIRVECMDRETHLKREARWLCSQQGWDCERSEYDAVVSQVVSLSVLHSDAGE